MYNILCSCWETVPCRRKREVTGQRFRQTGVYRTVVHACLSLLSSVYEICFFFCILAADLYDKTTRLLYRSGKYNIPINGFLCFTHLVRLTFLSPVSTYAVQCPIIIILLLSLAGHLSFSGIHLLLPRTPRVTITEEFLHALTTLYTVCVLNIKQNILYAGAKTLSLNIVDMYTYI